MPEALQETRIIHDPMKIPKIDYIPYIYILLKTSKNIKKIYNLGKNSFVFNM